jgi:hypothetical protein
MAPALQLLMKYATDEVEVYLVMLLVINNIVLHAGFFHSPALLYDVRKGKFNEFAVRITEGARKYFAFWQLFRGSYNR